MRTKGLAALGMVLMAMPMLSLHAAASATRCAPSQYDTHFDQSCIQVNGSGLHVKSITPSGERATLLCEGGPWTGHFKVLKNGGSFLESGSTYTFSCATQPIKEWTWNNGGAGVNAG